MTNGYLGSSRNMSLWLLVYLLLLFCYQKIHISCMICLYIHWTEGFCLFCKTCHKNAKEAQKFRFTDGWGNVCVSYLILSMVWCRSISALVSIGVSMEAHFSVAIRMGLFEFGALDVTERGRTGVDILCYSNWFKESLFPWFYDVNFEFFAGR